MIAKKAVSAGAETQSEALTTQIVPIEVMLDKKEATILDQEIIALTAEYLDEAGDRALKMKELEGWRALAFKSWHDYCKNVDERISKNFINDAACKALVERNIGARLLKKCALQLFRIKDAEGQREVYADVTKAFPKATEINYEAYVEGWLSDHDESNRKPGERAGRWTTSDLEDDPELATAFDEIQEVYGLGDRRAFQDGTMNWTRKDIIALSRLPVPRMKQLHYLIMETHWKLERAINFVDEQPDAKTNVHTLMRKGLGTPGLRYTFSYKGWDFSLVACQALAKKIRG